MVDASFYLSSVSINFLFQLAIDRLRIFTLFNLLTVAVSTYSHNSSVHHLSSQMSEHTLKPNHEEIYTEALRRSKRQRSVKFFYDEFIVYLIDDSLIVYLIDDSLKTIVDAFSSPDADDWKEVVHSEIDSLISNRHVSLLIDHMLANLVCKWVFKKKT